MKLTTKSEYALLSLIYMARNQDSFIKIEEICKNYKLSKKYLEQIFNTLKENKIIKTKTGPNGGYQLARPANKITTAEIIRKLDGALAPSLAVSHYFFYETPISQEKKIKSVLKEIRDYISQKLENLTIKDLI